MNYQKTYMNHIHSSSLLYQLATMWKTQTLCDAIIRTGSVITKAHRVVLVAACPMLQSMENAAAGSHLEVRLAADIKQDSVNTFLQYLYEGFMTLNEDNYKDIEKISRLLQVENAIKCCADFIKCISSSSANQYRYNYPDQLEFKHVRTTELQKVQDRHPKRSTDRPMSPGTKRPRFQRQSSPMSDSRTHDMSGMKESYTVNDPWDRVPRLGSHSSTPTSVHVPSQQPGVIDIIEDSIELLQTEPPGKRPGDEGRELRKVQSTVGVSVASQRDAPADVQIVSVPGAIDIPSQKSASESTTFIPSSPASSDSSSLKERPPHYSSQSFQPKPDLEKSNSDLPDLTSDVDVTVQRSRPPDTVVASPSTQPYPVAMTASSRPAPPSFQQKSFAAGSAMQAESISPSTVQRGPKPQLPHTISRVDSTEKASPMERSQDTGYQAPNRLSPDISIVKVENEVGAEETGMLDMYVANAGMGGAGHTHGQNEEEQSDFDVEEPPGDLQRDELSNESGNMSMDQSGNWYMGNFRGNTSSQGAKPISIEFDADDSAPSLDKNDVQQGLTAFEQIIGKREGESEEMSMTFSSTPFPTGCFPSKADTQTNISELETSQTGRTRDSRAPVPFSPELGHKQHAMLPDKSSTKGKPITAKKTPLQAPSFLCELCMASFYSENDLCIHKRSVNHKGLYYCRWCASSFRTKEERNKHVRCHVDGSMFVELCIPCGKGFKSRMGYNNHMKMYHTKEGEVQTFRCEVCGKSCVTKSQLNVHMKAHSDEQNFYCVTCNKSFKHKFTLQRHNCTVSQI